VCKDPSKFWDVFSSRTENDELIVKEFEFNRVISKIDFTKPLWRPLFSVDLSANPELQTAVNSAKKVIKSQQDTAQSMLKAKVTSDVIVYSVLPFF
jgi:hypothetical protein